MTLAKNALGLGLRTPHYSYIYEHKPSVDFFEIISENFMVDGGMPLTHLDRILADYSVVLHGVSMSLASHESLNFDYLDKLKYLADYCQAEWFSDHLCWSTAHGHRYYDLLPLPYTEENAQYIADRARTVQDYIGRPFAIENLSSYVDFKTSTMTEWEFYARIIELAGCYFMLDLNNVYVSSVNHHFDPLEYIKALPLDRVKQMHVAGHSENEDGTLLDTHDHPVKDGVWELYTYVNEQCGGAPTILEWDDAIPSFEDVWAEAQKARAYQVLEK